MSTKTDLPILAFADKDEWAAWLAAEHARSSGIWLKLTKKRPGHTSLTYAEALEPALCYGWIDGQKDKLDDEAWLQRFTPRRSKSKWSRINRDRATELISSGRMKEAGLREVEAAKADGRWAAAYESQSAATVPKDLQSALDANPQAAAFFSTLNSANRYAILWRLQDAKRPETRALRLAKFVAMLAEGQKLHP